KRSRLTDFIPFCALSEAKGMGINMKMHVGINVTNLEKSIDFYRNLFGARVDVGRQSTRKFLQHQSGTMQVYP
ncbi:VOC family protein, partial [Effusibacillus consociatus]